MNLALQSSSNSLQICPVTEALLPQVLQLDQLCFGGLWTSEGYCREIHSPNSDLVVIYPVAVPAVPNQTDAAPALLGLACLWAILDEAHITLLAIHPQYQTQGLGQTLLYWLLSSAHQRGLARATLEVRESNQAAIALYQKFGFQTAGRRRHYYHDTNEDALVLWRGGLQHPDFPQTLADWQAQVQDRLAQSNWRMEPSAWKVG